MSDFDTLDAITDNIETTLKGGGIVFTAETYDDIDAIPSAVLPLGQIFFNDIVFDHTSGEKPSYAEAGFMLRVILSEREPRMLAREEQRLAHLIRDTLTVNALNIGVIVESKLVSRVTTDSVRVEHHKPQYGILNYGVKIRYREI